MSIHQANPYAPTLMPTEANIPADVDAVLMTKINAIVLDAEWFWLAMILGFCSVLGSIIIGFGYAVRLMQWNALANSQTWLMVPNAQPGSLPANFQGAKAKFIIGMVFGFVLLLLLFAFICRFVILGVSVQVNS